MLAVWRLPCVCAPATSTIDSHALSSMTAASGRSVIGLWWRNWIVSFFFFLVGVDRLWLS
jgi:hypothetical protein